MFVCCELCSTGCQLLLEAFLKSRLRGNLCNCACCGAGQFIRAAVVLWSNAAGILYSCKARRKTCLTVYNIP